MLRRVIRCGLDTDENLRLLFGPNGPLLMKNKHAVGCRIESLLGLVVGSYQFHRTFHMEHEHRPETWTPRPAMGNEVPVLNAIKGYRADLIEAFGDADTIDGPLVRRALAAMTKKYGKGWPFKCDTFSDVYDLAMAIATVPIRLGIVKIEYAGLGIWYIPIEVEMTVGQGMATLSEMGYDPLKNMNQF